MKAVLGRWVGVHPAFEDGTDTGFRNVGQLQFDAGEIPRRKYTMYLFCISCKSIVATIKVPTLVHRHIY